MFGIGGTEALLIALFAFFIFGPDKLPQIGRTVGKALSMFKEAQDEMEKVIRAEMYAPDEKKPSTRISERGSAPEAEAAPAPVSVPAGLYAATDEDEEEEDEE